MVVKSQKIPLYFSFLILGLLVIYFENCANTSLEKSSGIVDSGVINANFEFCLDQEYSGYTIDTFIPTSLGRKYFSGSFELDSDYDGLPDKFEDEIGFDKYNPRTTGNVLDSICFLMAGKTNCNKEFTNLKCTGNSQRGFGFNDCDIEVIDLDLKSTNPGLDSDFDGIPDYLEIIRGTELLKSDANLDYDHDGITNLNELMNGGDSTYYDQPLAEDKAIKTSMKKISSASETCAGEYWSAKFENIGWKAGSFDIVDPLSSIPGNTVNLSTAKGTTMVLFTLKLRPLGATPGNPKLLVKVLTVDYKTKVPSFTLSDFIKAGEIK